MNNAQGVCSMPVGKCPFVLTLQEGGEPSKEPSNHDAQNPCASIGSLCLNWSDRACEQHLKAWRRIFTHHQSRDTAMALSLAVLNHLSSALSLLVFDGLAQDLIIQQHRIATSQVGWARCLFRYGFRHRQDSRCGFSIRDVASVLQSAFATYLQDNTHVSECRY
jgi:hypothetical protein